VHESLVLLQVLWKIYAPLLGLSLFLATLLGPLNPSSFRLSGRLAFLPLRCYRTGVCFCLSLLFKHYALDKAFVSSKDQEQGGGKPSEEIGTTVGTSAEEAGVVSEKEAKEIETSGAVV
jgi:hypothetical protein